jgi:hypothetical protein
VPTELDAAPETRDSDSQGQDSPPPDRDRPDVSADGGGTPSSPGNPEFEAFDPRGPKASDYASPHFGHLGNPLPRPPDHLPMGDRANEAEGHRGTAATGTAATAAFTAGRGLDLRHGPERRGG